ncbi:hypothetical protein HYPSUDRAFT_288879 [Hypholoma sublateritium FD-334 SS-4]|uniref:Uncharacterized protein n=1 Tax=Hypholoma sublateritium (strain FD-334 SS-4) TaxID=945553 RepID=A0A0D2P869_HYPSF|nr:hypothetical protein HYPSUDRAFT_288879 [Hypholoma sublateritium FD-334 SS-4]
MRACAPSSTCPPQNYQRASRMNHGRSRRYIYTCGVVPFQDGAYLDITLYLDVSRVVRSINPNHTIPVAMYITPRRPSRHFEMIIQPLLLPPGNCASHANSNESCSTTLHCAAARSGCPAVANCGIRAVHLIKTKTGNPALNIKPLTLDVHRVYFGTALSWLNLISRVACPPCTLLSVKRPSE